MNRFINRIFFVFAALLWLQGCGKEVDYDLNTVYIIVNSSSHVIEIEAQDSKVEELQYLLLKPGEKLRKVFSTFGYIEEYNFWGWFNCKITFDGEVSIVHEFTSECTPDPHCVYEKDSYERVKTGERSISLTYTFTDADYDYAVGRQTEIPVAYESLYK